MTSHFRHLQQILNLLVWVRLLCIHLQNEKGRIEKNMSLFHQQSHSWVTVLSWWLRAIVHHSWSNSPLTLELSLFPSLHHTDSLDLIWVNVITDILTNFTVTPIWIWLSSLESRCSFIYTSGSCCTATSTDMFVSRQICFLFFLYWGCVSEEWHHTTPLVGTRQLEL